MQALQNVPMKRVAAAMHNGHAKRMESIEQREAPSALYLSSKEILSAYVLRALSQNCKRPTPC